MEEKNKTTLWIIVGLVVLIILGYWVYQIQKTPEEKANLFITNFEECVQAGYPVMESYPRQCRTPEGKIYVEEIIGDKSAGTAVATGGCYIGGCSSQICSDEPGVVSTCEYKSEYSCYKTGICGRQAGGVCGWTQTPELVQCLNVNSDTIQK